MQIRLYGEQHQQKILKLKEVYGTSTVTKTLEQLIDTAYEQLESQGGPNVKTTEQRPAAQL